MSNLIYRKHMTSMKLKLIENKAAENGISASQLAMHLNENLPEKTVTTVKENGKTVDVIVKQNKQTDWSEDKLNNITLKKADWWYD